MKHLDTVKLTLDMIKHLMFFLFALTSPRYKANMQQHQIIADENMFYENA